ncbi:ABC transporter ATP-binding protein [Cellulosilyticum ruminicola]|uniref:ABC transporter ATP-binding protein n=1 Tax=Cellulosilyticum ruminicola TaxID=425254 RepID=UPI0006D2795F|nr:ABC transporter ATP-binding protein [Cellulosilyticum ruminicola]
MIEIKNLNYQIGQKHILKDINYKFLQGKIYGIIGPNGAGKSTILKHIMGMISPSKSTIFYEGKDIKSFKVKDYAKHISYVFQENPRDLDFTVYEILQMGRYTYMDLMGDLKEKDETLIKQVMEDLNLEGIRDVSIKNLSGGEAQKVFIARALVQDTPYLLLDEPTSMLDIHNSVELMHLIQQIKEKRNLTIIMVLHDLNLAFGTCDEMLILKDGTLVISGPTQEVLQNPILQETYNYKIHLIQDETATTYIVPVL